VRNRRPNERAVDYIFDLQELANKCAYGQFLGRALVQRLRAGIRDARTRRKLLSEANLTFEQAKTIILQEEAAQEQDRAIARQVPFHNVQSHSPCFTVRASHHRGLSSQYPGLTIVSSQLLGPSRAFSLQLEFSLLIQEQMGDPMCLLLSTSRKVVTPIVVRISPLASDVGGFTTPRLALLRSGNVLNVVSWVMCSIFASLKRCTMWSRLNRWTRSLNCLIF